jgi:hypothetical protein
MNGAKRLLTAAALALAALAASGCQGEGIGIGVPSGGARWGSGGAGPDVFVAGGPVYR